MARGAGKPKREHQTRAASDALDAVQVLEPRAEGEHAAAGGGHEAVGVRVHQGEGAALEVRGLRQVQQRAVIVRGDVRLVAVGVPVHVRVIGLKAESALCLRFDAGKRLLDASVSESACSEKGGAPRRSRWGSQR